MGKISLVLILFFSIIVFNYQSVVGEETEPLKFRVKADVAMEDEAIAGETESYIKRELKLLDDVIVVDTKPDFIIWVVMNKWKSIEFVNFAITYLQTHHYRYSRFLGLDEKYFNNNERVRHLYRYLANYVQRANLVYALTIKGCYYKGLENQCQSIVAEFDTKVLEPERNSYQKLRDTLVGKPKKMKTENE